MTRPTRRSTGGGGGAGALAPSPPRSGARAMRRRSTSTPADDERTQPRAAAANKKRPPPSDRRASGSRRRRVVGSDDDAEFEEEETEASEDEEEEVSSASDDDEDDDDDRPTPRRPRARRVGQGRPRSDSRGKADEEEEGGGDDGAGPASAAEAGDAPPAAPAAPPADARPRGGRPDSPADTRTSDEDFVADVDADTDGDASSSQDDESEEDNDSDDPATSSDREGILRRRSGRARAPVARYTPGHHRGDGRDGAPTTRRAAAAAAAAAAADPSAAIAGRYPRRDRGSGPVERFSPPKEEARHRALAVAQRRERGYGSGGGWCDRGGGEDGGWGGGRGRGRPPRGGVGWGDDEVPDRPGGGGGGTGGAGPAWGDLASSAAAWLAAGGGGPPWAAAGGGGHGGAGGAGGPHAGPPPPASTAAAAAQGGAADITPMTIDPASVSWDAVGGLDPYVRALKEMVFLPLAYPDLFARFRLDPPRGVLFYGPPGTGKTLVARALAASAARAGRPVSFFMRKGGDVLSKWVGEAERQLRALFDAAARAAPSIIFFDEIDGLAPVRSSKQDQVHASIVSTLLALMDGLDPRGAVVVVGATNRVDALDPALRRPGRFDRELLFPLPNEGARAAILRIHTRGWASPPPEALVAALAARTAGFGGADLKALATEAALRALRRSYPQIYESDARLAVRPADVAVTRRDWMDALGGVTPASARGAAGAARGLPPSGVPALGPALASALASVRAAFAPAAAVLDAAAAGTVGSLAVRAAGAGGGGGGLDDDDSDVEGGGGGGCGGAPAGPTAAPAAEALPPALLAASSGGPATAGAAVHVTGPPGCGAPALAAALLHALEGLPIHSLGLPALLAAPGARSPEEALVAAVSEARRAAPSILYLPGAGPWWAAAPRSLRAALEASLAELPRGCQVLVVSVAEAEGAGAGALPPAAAAVLAPPGATTVTVRLGLPDAAGRAGLLAGAAADAARPPDRRRAAEASVPAPLPVAAEPRAEAADEAAKAAAAAADAARAAAAADAATLRALRCALRDIATRLLLDRRWRPLAEPPLEDGREEEEEEEEEGGGEGGRGGRGPPADDGGGGGLYLATLLARVDGRAYPTAAAFLDDVATLPDAAARRARRARLGEAGVAREAARAHAAVDEAAALVAARVPPALEARCAAIEAAGGPAVAPPPPDAAPPPPTGGEAAAAAEEAEEAEEAAAPRPPPPRPPLPPPSAEERALAASTLETAVAKSEGWTLDAVEAAAAAMWGVCRARRGEGDRAGVSAAALRAAGLE